jgi:signal transduction histidine kinase
MAFREPTAVLLEIPRAEAEADHDHHLTRSDRATLRAIAGEAHRQLEHVTLALAAANDGLQIMASDRHAAVSIRLRLLRALMLDESNDSDAALRELDQLISEESKNPMAVACAQKDRGWIRDSKGDTGGALRDLIAASHDLRVHGPEAEAMVAAGRLASVYSATRDYASAETLVTETIGYFAKIGAWVRVATARDRLGNIYLAQGRVESAVRQFAEVRRLSELTHDTGGVAFADLRLCQAEIARRDFTAAHSRCESAETNWRRLDTLYPAEAANLHTQFGRIALGRGDPERAAMDFQQAIGTGAVELKGSLGARAYQGLGEAQAALGHFKAAYLAGLEYQHRAVAEQNAQSARELAALRVHFDMDREIAKNGALTRERAALLDRNARAAAEKRLIIAIAVISLLTCIGFLGLMHRRRVAVAARRAAEVRADELGRLCAGVAHDFNNLMTIVQQAAGLLAHRLASTGHWGDDPLIDAIRQAAVTGGDITRQLLAFGRQQNMKPRLISCSGYFAERKSLFEQTAGGAIGVTAHSIDPNATVWTDPSQLTNALVNLVLNAKEAIAGSGHIEITVRAATNHPDCTSISVIDNGRGMSEDVRQQCVEVFFSTKAVGLGSGLGLSAVHGFAGQSGGELAIESEVGRGTTVTMILPAHDKPAARMA